MYKKQLKIQKYICMLCVIAAAVTFIYALGMITDIHDALISTMRNPLKPTQTKVEGSWIYYDMQPFNKQFVNMSILPILLACFLFITNTNTRRKYYFTNYLAVGAYSAATLYVGFWAHPQIEAFAVQYMTTINFEQLEEYAEFMGTPYLDNTNMLDLHRWVLVFAVLSVAALVGNMIWKIILMRKEKKLLAAGEEVAV
jgi:hypothetical protein